MPRKRREIPTFFSFEIGPVRGIAESMADEDWGRWSKRALNDLSFGCTRKDTDPRVRKMYENAKESMDSEYERKKKWYEEQKNLNAGAPNGSNGVITEPTTVCKNADEGGTRKDPLNMATVRKNGALESGTSSANLRGSARPQKTGAGASIAPLLISPLENRAPSPTIANRSDKKQPVNIGAAAPAPPLGPLDCHNREPQAPSPEASHISGDVLNLAYSGEFGNVRLTQEQYAQLGIKFGNQQKLNRAIDSLSCQIENGEKNPANHYAELVKWANYRDDMEEKEELKAATLPHYETVSEHNARIVRESDAWIHEYCQQQKKNRKAANG